MGYEIALPRHNFAYLLNFVVVEGILVISTYHRNSRKIIKIIKLSKIIKIIIRQRSKMRRDTENKQKILQK